ncbi:MAG: hypothetical protein IBX64_13735 [Actinobacteria bacterium]|nr:hypothetical protein [Actinomycetota bacterium]
MGYRDKNKRREYDRLYKQRLRRSKATVPLHEQISQVQKLKAPIIEQAMNAPEMPVRSLESKPFTPIRRIPVDHCPVAPEDTPQKYCHPDTCPYWHPIADDCLYHYGNNPDGFKAHQDAILRSFAYNEWDL